MLNNKRNLKTFDVYEKTFNKKLSIYMQNDETIHKNSIEYFLSLLYNNTFTLVEILGSNFLFMRYLR